jgi:hypothetical protein
MACFQRPRQLASLLIYAHFEAKEKYQTWIFLTHSTIIIISKVVAVNIMIENFHIEQFDRVYGEVSSFASTNYLLHRDMSKVLFILMLEKSRQKESNLDVLEARITAPKTAAERIGKIKKNMSPMLVGCCLTW